MTKRLTWQMGFDDAVSGGPSHSEYCFVDGRPEYRVGYTEYRQRYLEGTRARAGECETGRPQTTGDVQLSSTADILLRRAYPQDQAANTTTNRTQLHEQLVIGLLGIGASSHGRSKREPDRIRMSIPKRAERETPGAGPSGAHTFSSSTAVRALRSYRPLT